MTFAAVYYLLAAFAITLWLWRDPASRTVAGNPNDADQFAWFFRYDAAALAHGRLPDLVTLAMNAPQGVNVMWNTFMLLPGMLLAPVTLLFGPQTALTVFLTAGFAGSALAMFAVLRRWSVGVPGAALAGAVYGFSPALAHSAIGHYDLQFAVLPPLIIDAGLALAAGRSRPVRGGGWLGLLVTAQIFITEETLLITALAGMLFGGVLAASRPRAALAGAAATARGLAVAAGVTAVIAGYPLLVQFFGPLAEHSSPFTPDYFKNDLSAFVVPSSYLLFHTSGSAAAAGRYQGLLPEYLGYLGWPLLITLLAAAIWLWRRPPARAAAVTWAVLEVCSLGGTLLFGGREHAGITLPWHWLQGLPLLSAALPDRFSIVADGAAAVLLAFAADAAFHALRRRWAGWRPAAVVVSGAILAVLPIVPSPLPAAAATPLPPGWSQVFASLRLPASANVLVVPVPRSTFTESLRWQADTGVPGEMVGGYFMGPAWNGHAYTDGNGTPAAGLYLNYLWLKSAGTSAAVGPKPVSQSAMLTQIEDWRVSAVVAVTAPDSPLARYLSRLLGRPAAAAGDVVAWR
jgi:hypothetical protein